jgi:hypothetical protein
VWRTHPMAPTFLRRTLIALSIVPFAVGGALVLDASANSLTNPTPAQVQAQIDTTTAQRNDAQARLAQAQHDVDALVAERAALSARQQDLTTRLAVAQRDARQLAISVFVAGGHPGTLELMKGADLNDLAFRSYLLATQADLTAEAATRYATLVAQADVEVRAAASRTTDLDAKVASATHDIEIADQQLESLHLLLRVSQARALAPASTAPGDAWARLRQCESSGNYQAVDSSGLYRGAYQFDLQTWRSVGGEGDPIDAPGAEQDARAQILYSRRGPGPWPVCGRFLRALD